MQVLNGNVVRYLVRKCSEGPYEQEYYASEDKFLDDRFDWPSIGDAYLSVEAVNNLNGGLLQGNESYYSRLVFPPACGFSVPIQPGIFKATMGMTGIRLVILSYPDENTVEGLTISVWLR